MGGLSLAASSIEDLDDKDIRDVRSDEGLEVYKVGVRHLPLHWSSRNESGWGWFD